MASSAPVKFNYAKARAAGFTDEQIAQSIAAKRAQGINVYVDRGEVSAVRSGALSVAPRQSALQQIGGIAKAAMPRTGDLPYLGAVGGGALGFLAGGPVGSVAGAGIGGSLGEGYRQSLTQKNLQPLTMGIRGSEQALLDATGQSIGGALKGIADRAIPPKPFPTQLRTIPVKSKILDEYGSPFRRRVQFSPKAPPAPAAPEPVVTVADVMHLMSKHGLVTKLATSKPVVKRLAALNGPMLQALLRQSPRALVSYLNQPAEADALGQ